MAAHQRFVPSIVHSHTSQQQQLKTNEVWPQIFSQISYRLPQLKKVRTSKGVLRLLNRIISDITTKDIDTDHAAPSCSKEILVDVKTLFSAASEGDCI